MNGSTEEKSEEQANEHVGGTRSDRPLAMDSAEFRRVGSELVDSIAEFLGSVPDRPVTPAEPPSTLEALVDGDGPLATDGEPAEDLLRSASKLLFDHSLLNGHPRFFGYITSSPAPIGILGDLLAAAVNANLGSYQLAPMATTIEQQTVRWIADLIGYPRDCGGLLTSGGNMANFAGLIAARAAAADWDVRASGLRAADARPFRIYCSAETHTWVQKAADMAGIGTDSIRWIPTDADHRMDTTRLRETIDRDRAAGDLPLMVIGTGGSVSTGVVDPLFDLAALCREYGIWFHVDGAYGAFAAVDPDAPEDLRGLREADSVAVDPHKWLYAPLEAGCILARDPEALRAAFSYHPPYYHFGEEAVNYVDFGPQNSRGFRALKVWLGLRHAGRDGYVRRITGDIRLSRRLHERIVETPELEPATQGLSITTFRYVPSDLEETASRADCEAYLNQLNRALLDRIQRSGEAFVSNAVVRGRYLLRACIVNLSTTEADVDALPEIVARLGREVDSGLRSRLPGSAG